MRKLTLEEVRKRCKKNGLKLLDEEYKGNKQKITCVDNEGYKYNFILTALNKGMPRRFGKGNPYTVENIKLFLKRTNVPLTLISEKYLNSCVDKMKWKCEEGHIFEATWNNIQKGNRCPECAVKRRALSQTTTLEEFIEKLKCVHGNKYKVVSGYTKIGSKVKIECDCGNVWEPYAYSLLQGFGCKICGIEKRSNERSKTHEEYLEEIKRIHGDEYEILEEYKRGHEKILVKHKKCGRKYRTQAQSLVQGKGCKKCAIEEQSKKRIKGADDFIDKVWELVGNEYSVMTSDFKLRSEKIKMRHNDCGYVYEVTPQKFLAGRRCPACRESYGEAQVRAYLEKEGYYFVPQYAFDDLVNEKKLRFDFVVFEKDRILFAVEYDGEQHFKPIPFWGGLEGFKRNKARDEMKNKYCQDNNIPLIRIPFNTKDIFTELENQISKLNIHV